MAFQQRVKTHLCTSDKDKFFSNKKWKQKRSTKGFSKFKVRKHDRLRLNGLNIRTNASPQMGQEQVSGGVSVLCWLAALVAMFYGNLRNKEIRSKSVIRYSSVISSQIGVMSDQLRVIFVYGHVPECHVTVGRGRLPLYCLTRSPYRP